MLLLLLLLLGCLGQQTRPLASCRAHYSLHRPPSSHPVSPSGDSDSTPPPHPPINKCLHPTLATTTALCYVFAASQILTPRAFTRLPARASVNVPARPSLIIADELNGLAGKRNRTRKRCCGRQAFFVLRISSIDWIRTSSAAEKSPAPSARRRPRFGTKLWPLSTPRYTKIPLFASIALPTRQI